MINHMFAGVTNIIHKAEIASARNKIRKMERSSYLNMYERMELRDLTKLLSKAKKDDNKFHFTFLNFRI